MFSQHYNDIETINTSQSEKYSILLDSLHFIYSMSEKPEESKKFHSLKLKLEILKLKIKFLKYKFFPTRFSFEEFEMPEINCYTVHNNNIFNRADLNDY